MGIKEKYKVLCGDAVQQLKRLPDESVQMCVTSPPYWNLRDYGTATWEGGSADCKHVKQTANGAGKSTLNSGRGGGPKLAATVMPYGAVCGKCGAKRIDKQIGIEESPQAYIDALVRVFEQVRRVLKKDGILWINIGDSYARQGGAKTETKETISAKTSGARKRDKGVPPSGLKQKDLVGIPWMLAFALRDAGWYLRMDCIWKKGNSLPESIKDRPSKSHEYIFLLSKSARYYYDWKAVVEPAAESTAERLAQDIDGQQGSARAHGGGVRVVKAMKPSVVGGTKYDPADPKNKTKGGLVTPTGWRNRRSVWEINSAGIRDEHFAPFPPEIPRICILAGSKKGDWVLDPFTGSGTTGFVALRLGRRFVGTELSRESVKIAERRFIRAIPSLRWELY